MKHGRSELGAALGDCRMALAAIVAFSALINVLTLTGAIFMLQVYDRVVPSRSVATLVGLSLIALVLYLTLGLFDQLRARILIRVGAYFGTVIEPRVFRAVVSEPLKSGTSGDGMQPLRDLDQIRHFLSGAGPAAFADLPFLPVQLLICFLIHPLIGAATLAGALLIFLLTLATDMAIRRLSLLAAETSGQRSALLEAGRRNAEVLRSLGMQGRMGGRWAAINRTFDETQSAMLDRSTGFAGASRIFRMLFQSAVLALGAFLVIEQEASFGVIIAASILSARALLPVEQVVANWRSFVAARQGWRRLSETLARHPEPAQPMALPPPRARLEVERLTVVPPGASRPAVADASFQVAAGSALGIIGPSGAGKSTLARAIIGAWTPANGRVRLDSADLGQWDADALGRHLGYLPQDVELFSGTVADNIARFQPDADPEAIVAAARAAGVHDMILRLPAGYMTEIGESGSTLSAGQRQRIGLARALFGDPFLVVLDEPYSNLDAEGDSALTQAIMSARLRGAIVLIVAHRPSALDGVDQLLTLLNGHVAAFGPKDEVLRRIQRPNVVQAQKEPASAGALRA